jgi:polyhydroxybutyrate depolymerase
VRVIPWLVGLLVLGSMACSSDGEAPAGGAQPFAGGVGGTGGGTSPPPAGPAEAANPAAAGASAEGPPSGVSLNPAEPVGTVSGGGVPGGDGGAVGGLNDAGSVGSGPGSQPPLASTGCGKANPPQGAASLTIRGAQADYVVTLPSGYSPDTPTPLVFAFHGRNRTHVQLQTVDAGGIQTELGSRAIMVYMKSQGGTGWNFAEEVPPSVEFFDALQPQVFDNYCVDTSKVYAVGHSSGGYFSIILACRYGDLFRGIGSVAGALQETACTGDRVAGMFIHGANDTVVANTGGRAARDLAITTNACQNTTVPGAVAPCLAYQGCADGYPVEWCEHGEPTYLENNVPTNHGWPSFASRAINQFFLSLP